MDAYPNFEVTPSRVRLWLQQLSDIPAEHAMDKLLEHIKTNKFMPTIADLREGYVPPPEPTEDELEMQRWIKECQRDGFYTD